MNSTKRLFPFVYIAFLLFAYFYAKDIINSEELIVAIKNKDKVVEEVKPVRVSLVIKGISQTNTYALQLKNTNTFDDLLEELVKKNLITYEKTEYTYGTEYDHLNGESASEDYVWKVYAGDDDITYKTKGVKLADKTTYTLELDKK